MNPYALRSYLASRNFCSLMFDFFFPQRVVGVAVSALTISMVVGGRSSKRSIIE